MTCHVVAGERLMRSLERSADDAGCPIVRVAEISKPWDTGCYEGGQHEVTVCGPVGTLDAWLDGLTEDSIIVPGFVTIGLTVSSVGDEAGRTLATIEAQTVRQA